MTESTLTTLARDAIMVALMLGAPFFAVSLVIGLIVSLFQAVTQITEMTLSFVPKLLGIVVVLLLLGPWFLHQIARFTVQLFELLPQMVR
jgi:flagellar biosynthetic protein FliQ